MLRRWKAAEGEMRYTLRRVDEDAVQPLDEPASSEDHSNYGYVRECSTSSINSVNLPYQPRHKSARNGHGQSSTSSLPAYSDASLSRRRPPPPDYNSTMERKLAGIAKTTEAQRSKTMGSEEARVADLKLTHNDLLNLIHKQDAILDEQRNRLKMADLSVHSELEREFMQLDAQQKNLKRVLDSLRRVDYGKQYEEETLRHRQLRARVLATHEKLSLINESRTMLSEQEASLWQQMHDISSDDSGLLPADHAFPFAKNNVHLTQFHSAI